MVQFVNTKIEKKIKKNGKNKMKIEGKSYKTIWFENNSVKIIDQTKLPHQFVIKDLKTVKDSINAIKTMEVRGAPLIGATAAYGLVLSIIENNDLSFLKKSSEDLIASRPTAINLKWAVDRMMKKLIGVNNKNILKIALDEAKAIKEEDLISSEPTTVVLSKKGLVRAAKGHEVDGQALNYKTSDGFLMQAKGRSNQQAVFIDTVGRSYSLAVHSLPSARSHGEPLTARLRPAPGVGFVGVFMGLAEQYCLLASDAGYGFITKLENLHCKNRNGKSALKCPTNSTALKPSLIKDSDAEFIAAVSSEGRLLVFPVAELPELAKGKGNKIMQIPPAKLKVREEWCVAVAVLNEEQNLILYSGKRHLKLKPKDWEAFEGERGRRGNLLPRGFRKVDAMIVE